MPRRIDCRLRSQRGVGVGEIAADAVGAWCAWYALGVDAHGGDDQQKMDMYTKR